VRTSVNHNRHKRFERLENRILEFCHLISQVEYRRIQRCQNAKTLLRPDVTNSLSFLQNNTSIHCEILLQTRCRK